MKRIIPEYCPKNCRFLDPTEEQQQMGDKRKHLCLMFSRPLMHLYSHPKIHRCQECKDYIKHVGEIRYEREN